MIEGLFRVKGLVFLIGFCAMALPQLAALADTAGILSGTVTDDRTHRPIAGIAVVAKSPSATYRTVTDAKGQYRFLSVLPVDAIVGALAADPPRQRVYTLDAADGRLKAYGLPLRSHAKAAVSLRCLAPGGGCSEKLEHLFLAP